jgi:ribosomal protein S18
MKSSFLPLYNNKRKEKEKKKKRKRKEKEIEKEKEKIDFKIRTLKYFIY